MLELVVVEVDALQLFRIIMHLLFSSKLHFEKLFFLCDMAVITEGVDTLDNIVTLLCFVELGKSILLNKV